MPIGVVIFSGAGGLSLGAEMVGNDIRMAVDYLGMPVDAMPFYSDSVKWKKKAERIMDFILEVGNFGHNRDSNYMKYPYVIRKSFSMGRRLGDSFRHARIFPLDSLRFFPYKMFNGAMSAMSAMRGE